ncbi:hypothetical protein JTB14_010858 [Gonioctena quinquepunctata]|nr:hypothetical protein JTB14_010858 [Gonioctena quinquepunctata]
MVDLSDHDLTLAIFSMPSKDNKPIFKVIHDFKNFLAEDFLEDLITSDLEGIFQILDVNEKVAFFNYTLASLFNKHAPQKKIKITKKHCPWLTDNLRFLMKLRDSAHSKWKKTKSTAHYDSYKQLRNYTMLACKHENLE